MKLGKSLHAVLTGEIGAIRVSGDLRLEDVDERAGDGSHAAWLALSRKLQRQLTTIGNRARRRAETALSGGHTDLRTPREGAFRQGLRRLLRSTCPTAGLTPSKRLTMPDSGGRSFHFEHVSVRPDSCSLKKGQRLTGNHKVGKSQFAKDITHTTRASVHQRYIVREGAVERLSDPATMQRYIDDGVKTNPLLHGSNGGDEFSFGTPGLSVDDMCEMWELAEFYARGEKTPVIQHRMIVELPHEATPLDRIAIMRAFVAPLEKAGIPYWVSIHAPTPDNDERNFHAHVVFLNRPAKKIMWPEGGDRDFGNKPDVLTWNFACVTAKQDKHRKTRDRYLERKKVPPLLRGTWVKEWRHRYAAIVNDQMIKSGKTVRFDPRSYKDAGLVDVVPEKKSGYARKIVERHEPSLDDIIADLSRAAFREAEAEFETERRKIARATSAAASGADPFVALLRELDVLADDNPIERRQRAFAAPSRHLAYSYFAAQEALIDLQITSAAEQRLLQTIADAASPEALAESRRRIAAEMTSRTPDTRERSRTALAELPDDEAARDLRSAVFLELEHSASLRLRQIQEAEAAVTAASADWLSSLEPQAIVMPARAPYPEASTTSLVTHKPMAPPPVHASAGGATLPSSFGRAPPRETIQSTTAANRSVVAPNKAGRPSLPNAPSARAPDLPSEKKAAVAVGSQTVHVGTSRRSHEEDRSALHQEAIEARRRATSRTPTDERKNAQEKRRAAILANAKPRRGSDFGL